jgi:hypothetical protein
MRLPRLAAVTAAAFGAGLAACAAAPAAQAVQSAAASSSNPAAGAIYSVPMISGPAAVRRDLPPDPAPAWLAQGSAIAQDAAIGQEWAAGGSTAPRLWLRASVSGPAFGDDYDEMYYALGVTNSRNSQAAATGLVVRMRMLGCTQPDEPDAQCVQEKTFTEQIDSLAPGQTHVDIIRVALPDSGSAPYLRFTPEIVHVG